MKYHASLKQRKRKRINDLCAKMRKVKEDKRLSMPKPEYPPDITENWIEITVTRGVNEHKIVKHYFLDSVSANTFAVWDDIRGVGGAAKRGVMGQQKAFKLISGDFPKIRRINDL